MVGLRDGWFTSYDDGWFTSSEVVLKFPFSNRFSPSIELYNSHVVNISVFALWMYFFVSLLLKNVLYASCVNFILKQNNDLSREG